MTNQRRLILEVIQNSTEHMTADQIYALAKEKMPNIALGTVYRNLGLMAQANEIMLIAIPDQPNHYDKNVVPHEHFHCTKCGRLYDLFDFNLIAPLTEKIGMQVTGYHLSVEGICSECAGTLQ